MPDRNKRRASSAGRGQSIKRSDKGKGTRGKGRGKPAPAVAKLARTVRSVPPKKRDRAKQKVPGREKASRPGKAPVVQRGKVERESGRKCSGLNIAIIVLVVLLLAGGGVGAYMYFATGTTNASVTTTPTHTPFKTEPAMATKATTTAATTTPAPVVMRGDPDWIKFRGECGKPKQRPDLGRIVGGSEAVKHSWPWQIGLLKYKQFSPTRASKSHICGGSLVGPKFVISATHCFLNKKQDGVITEPDGYRVLIGAHSKGKTTGGARIVEIKKILHHPKNNLAVFRRLKQIPLYDLTLLLLKLAVNPNVASPVTAFACLPPLGMSPPTNAKCWTSGWGKTMGTGHDRVLKQVAAPIVSTAACRKKFSKALKGELHVCGGPVKGSQGTCQGDSGGPLVCQYSDGVWVLHGATSFGPQPCGIAPAAWANVATNMDWVCCHLGGYGPCKKIKCKRSYNATGVL